MTIRRSHDHPLGTPVRAGVSGTPAPTLARTDVWSATGNGAFARGGQIAGGRLSPPFPGRRPGSRDLSGRDSPGSLPKDGVQAGRRAARHLHCGTSD